MIALTKFDINNSFFYSDVQNQNNVTACNTELDAVRLLHRLPLGTAYPLGGGKLQVEAGLYGLLHFQRKRGCEKLFSQPLDY
jgi:hypothetical protein